jgi:hypothetical protein
MNVMSSEFTLKSGFCLLAVFLVLAFGQPDTVSASDIGNCLLCHKYPGLSRVDPDGKFRLLYVNEDVFNKSIHAKVKCEGCHADVKKIPHDAVKKVDCLSQCHIVEPTSEKKFSHKDVAEFLAKSVHGEFDQKGQRKKHPEDLPSCKNCHDNPMYRPLSFFKRVRYGISEEALGRCRVCHKKDDFIFTFYNHVTTRLHTTRSPKNIAEVCARCHDNPEIVARHDLTVKAVASYTETFHGKAAEYLSESTPDCLDCHVNKGQSVHQMLSSKDPASITYRKNRLQACTNMECHPGATDNLADYNVHPAFSPKENPRQFYFTAFFIVLAGGTLLPLMVLMFMDLVRRVFPNASMKRKK